MRTFNSDSKVCLILVQLKYIKIPINFVKVMALFYNTNGNILGSPIKPNAIPNLLNPL